jgi:hydroxymethylpyrimidine/phosphomethylpyrimidine kinase
MTWREVWCVSVRANKRQFSGRHDARSEARLDYDTPLYDAAFMSKASEQMLKNEPVVLTIAGSDSSGGAGIEADLKVFSALDAYGTVAITCVTAQNPSNVHGIQAVDAAMVAAQIRAVCEVFPVAAVKTGMLYSAEIIRAVASEIVAQGLPVLVVDPVMVAHSGARLLQADAVEVLCRELIPHARVVTPNLHEAEILWGRSIASVEDLRHAARDICERLDVACVAKGAGLGDDEDNVIDVLFDEGEEYLFKGKRILSAQTHGAGCAFSAALTAYLGKGFYLSEAVARAKHYVAHALRLAVEIGRHRPLKFNWTATHGGEPAN